jgi:type IV pilus assembly protein PilC
MDTTAIKTTSTNTRTKSTYTTHSTLAEKLSTGATVDCKIRVYDKINLIENLRDELSAGIDVIKTLHNTAKNTSNKRFAAILYDMANQIDNGHKFGEAINRYPKAFPEYYRALIGAAEVTGNWTSTTKNGVEKVGILDLILAQLKRDEKIRSKVKAAMTYPTFILGVICVALLLITFIVLPQMRDFFSALDMQKNLNFASRSLLAVGDFIEAYYYSIPVVLTAAVLAVIFAWRTVGRSLWQKHCFDMPYLIGKTIKKITVAETFALLATLLRAGITPSESLRIIIKATTNPFVAEGLKTAEAHVQAGKNFSENIRDAHPIFTEEAFQVLSSAETTGKLDERPLTYAQSLFNKAEEEIDNLIAIIPSVMLICVGVIVAFIAIGFYGSFFGAFGQLSGQH